MAATASTARTAGVDHLEVVQDLAADLLGQAEDLGRGMAEHLHEIVPELMGGDRELFEETRSSCEANIAQVLRLVKRGAPATALVLPPEAAAFVHGVVRRGYPLPLVLRSYRRGHQWLWEQWSELLHARLDDPPALHEALEFSSAWLFEYVDVISDLLVEEYGNERDRLVRSAAAVRAETVQAILSGDSFDEEVASARLGYELRRHHLALRVCGEAGPGGDVRGLERAAHEAAAALGCRQPLVIVSGATVLSVWCGSREPNDDEHLAALEAYEPPEGIRVTAGTPGPGVEGFRRSQAEAAQAARVAALADTHATSVVTYRAVELVSLLAADFERAKRFVAAQLGPLAGPDDAMARLRETVLAFLTANGSNVRVARALHIHQNTVIYRVNRAEELLERPVTARQAELTCALMLAARLGPAVLTPAE